MDTESEVIQKACGDVLKNVSKNRRHIIKRDYFDKMQVGEISLKSPVKKLSDEEWQALTALWLTPRHRVCFFCFSERNSCILPIFILCILLEEQGYCSSLHNCAHLQTTCMKNKENRAVVKFQHKTGSRSYAAHVHAAVRTLLQNFRLQFTLVSNYSLCSDSC